MLPLTECVWDFQSNALWDTLLKLAMVLIKLSCMYVFFLQIHFIQDSNGVGEIVYLFDYITGDSVGVSAVTLHIFRPIMILVFKIHLGA